MATKIGDRFFPHEGMTREGIAAELVAFDLNRPDGSPPSDAEQEFLIAYVAERLTDAICLDWIEAHESNAGDRLADETDNDTYLDREAEIDSETLSLIGFHSPR